MFGFIYNVFSRSIIVLVVSALAVNYLPDKLFQDFPFEPRSGEPLDFDSVIPQWNTKLSDNKPEFIQLNQIVGPESIAISPNGLWYTGLADGRIVELDPKNNYKLRTVLRHKSASKCKDNNPYDADECGRYLQLRFVNQTLFAVEANSGLYKIDTKSGSKVHLGPKPLSSVTMYNSFAFDPKESDIVYITVSTTKYSLLNIVSALLERDNSGQIVALNTKTGKRVVVASKLSLTNGLDVDAKRDQIVFTQSGKSQISAIALSQIRSAFKASQDGDVLNKSQPPVTALVPLLPGMPDNIMIEGDMAYVALPLVKNRGKELIDHLTTLPNLIKAYGRLIYGAAKALEYVHVNIFPHPALESLYKDMKCGHINYRLLKTDRAAVYEYNLDTGASRLFGSNTFGFVSEATPTNIVNGVPKQLILGSFRSPFIVKVNL